MPTLNRVCVATALLFSFLIAAPATALPITWQISDDDREARRAGRWRLSVDVSHLDDHILRRLTDDGEVSNVASNVVDRLNPGVPVRDDDDRLKPRPSSERPETSQTPVPVPEPGSLALVVLGVALRRARRRA
jgi:MYXO-CTERM domain-containing protein